MNQRMGSSQRFKDALAGPHPLRKSGCKLLAAFFITGCAIASAVDAPTSKTVVYLGGNVVDSDSGSIKLNAAIVTQGDRIVAVRSGDGVVAKEGEQVVDIRGKFVVPGLVNTHVHIATLADPPTARAYLRRELYSGVTTVRDMAGDARLLGELQRAAEFDEIPSPDIFFVALMAGPEFFVDPRTHDAARGRVAGQVPWMQAITSQTNLPLAIAEARGTGATAIKLYGDLSAILVREITREAHRQHLLVWAHAAVFPALPRDVAEAGVDVISHACLLGYQLSSPPVLTAEDKTPVDKEKALHPSREMDDLLKTIKQRGTILDATLYVYDITPTAFTTCPPGVNDYLAREAYRAGIPISAGTDDDPDWADPDSALDTELSLLVERVGMTPAEALRSATLISARAAGQDKESGTIEAGKLADFVVLENNPLTNIANIRSVWMVVKHGIRYPRSEYKPVTADDLKKAPK